jgi:hypothetical protein
LATVARVVLIIGIREEFRQRELHFAKNGARIIVVARLAVLFGETEMASREHELNTAFHTDHREHTDSYIDVIRADTIDEVSVEAATNRFGNSVNAHAAMSERTATFNELTVKADRSRNLDNHRRKCRFAVTTEISFVKAEAVLFGVGSEDRYILFASVKYNFLIEGTKTFNFLNSATAHTRFESYAEIVADGYLIEAFVERHGFDIDVGVDYLNAFTSDSACFINYFLSHIAKVYPNIFKAVLIARRIENFIDADAAKLFFIAAKPT